MIRRRPPRPGADANQVAPANPVSATGAPPPGSIPPGGDQPPRLVIDELMAAFSVTEPPAPPKPQGALAGPERAEPVPPGTGSADGIEAPATRAMSPDEIGSHIESGPPPEPASVPALVPEPTRHSTRRSRKEAKREAKREKKRLAEHEKTQKKALKQTRSARRQARRQEKAKGPSRWVGDVGSDVRIITSDDPSVPPVIPTLNPVDHARPAPAHPAVTAPGGSSARADGPTVRIGGDDLPDAVYVEGDLAAGAGAGAGGRDRSTVFIDEDPSHADVVSIDVATSASRMEPRIRERRIAVKRAVGRRRLKWTAIVAGVLLVGVAGFAVLGSGLFKITTVEVDGRVYSGGAAFDAVIAELEGANVLRVDTDEVEHELELIAWIDDARVTTDFPNGARIEVREREPSIAYQGTDGRYRVLDREGRVLDVIVGQPVAYLELFVTGSAAANLDVGRTAPPGYRAAATLAQALTPEIRARAVSISADAQATDLRMLIRPTTGTRNIEVRFGAAQDLVDKLVRLQTVLTDPDPERAPTELIDVSGSDLNVR